MSYKLDCIELEPFMYSAKQRKRHSYKNVKKGWHKYLRNKLKDPDFVPVLRYSYSYEW